MKKTYRIPYDTPDFDAEENDQTESEPLPDEPELLGHYFGLLLIPGSILDPLAQAEAIEKSQDDNIWSIFVPRFQFRDTSGRLLKLKEVTTLPPIYCVIDGNKHTNWETVRPDRTPHMNHVPAKPEGMTDDEYDAIWSNFLDENLAFWKENLKRTAKERGNDYAILIDCRDEMKGYIRFNEPIYLK